jgi:ribonuclease R
MPRSNRPPSRPARTARTKKKTAGREPPTTKRPEARKQAKKQSAPGFVDPHAEREAQRYEHPIPSREAILALLTEHGSLLRPDAVADALGIDDPPRREALDKRLRAMLRDGQLLQSRRGGVAPAEKIGLIAGTVLANADGYGFLRPDEGGDDLYLSPAQMRQVLHGDRVLASVVGLDRRGPGQGSTRYVLQMLPAPLCGRVL